VCYNSTINSENVVIYSTESGKTHIPFPADLELDDSENVVISSTESGKTHSPFPADLELDDNKKM